MEFVVMFQASLPNRKVTTLYPLPFATAQRVTSTRGHASTGAVSGGWAYGAAPLNSLAMQILVTSTRRG